MAKIGVSESVPDPVGGGVAPGDGWDGSLSLADRLDELLLRLEVWRERPKVAGTLIIASGFLAAAAWWAAQPPESTPVEDTIPMASIDGGLSGPSDSQADEPGREPGVAGTAQGTATGTERGTAGVAAGDAAGGDGSAEHDAAQPGVEVRSDELVVHVVGAVQRPGLVRVPPGSRIDDVLRAAGGPVAEADVEQLNLAAPAADGMQVRVPAHGEEQVANLIVSPEASPTAEAPSGPMNLNTASESQLQDLPGVGPATAAAIVTWRGDNGGFLTVDDLTQVPGIGPVKLAALRDLVTV